MTLGLSTQTSPKTFFLFIKKKRYQEFCGKFLLSHILQWIIYNQPFCNRMVKSLATNRFLAETLVGVIGDILPAKKMVSIVFLLQLLVVTLKVNKRADLS